MACACDPIEEPPPHLIIAACILHMWDSNFFFFQTIKDTYMWDSNYWFKHFSLFDNDDDDIYIYICMYVYVCFCFSMPFNSIKFNSIVSTSSCINELYGVG